MIKANRFLFWMCVLVAVNQLGFGGIMPALPRYAQSFGVYGLARFAGASPVRWLADAFGRRSAMALGGVVT